MKIFAQSTLANGSPYIHLGYGSTTMFKPQQTFLNGGIASLILGMAMVGGVIVSKVASRVATLNLIRRRWIMFLVGGCLFMVMGGVGLCLSYFYAREEYTWPEGVTNAEGRSILYMIEKSRDRGQVITDLSGAGLSPDISDGWRNPFRLVVTGEQAARTYTVLSAGPDGRFGTADDLRFTLEPASRPAEPSDPPPVAP
jgi:hypothetical protein